MRSVERDSSTVDAAASVLFAWAVAQATWREEVRDHEVSQGELVYHDPDGLL